MGCVAVMLHIHTPAVEARITISMSSYPIDPEQTTQRRINDLGHDVSKYKRDPSNFRLPWLRRLTESDCEHCRRIRRLCINSVVYTLAVYGLYSIFY
jgi:hypothetical protein